MKKLSILLTFCTMAASAATTPAPTWKETLTTQAKEHGPWIAGIAAGTTLLFADYINGNEELGWRSEVKMRKYNSETTVNEKMWKNYPIRWPLFKIMNPMVGGGPLMLNRILGLLVIGGSVMYGGYKVISQIVKHCKKQPQPSNADHLKA